MRRASRDHQQQPAGSAIPALAERLQVLLDAWLTRDERIAPIVLLEEPDDSENSRLRREDEKRRDEARRQLIEVGREFAAAIIPLACDTTPLLTLLDCAVQYDLKGAENARPGARVFLQQVVLKSSAAAEKREPDAISPADANASRARSLRNLERLITAIGDGFDVDSLRPIAWELEADLHALGFVSYHLKTSHR